jgi:hypothetical protein
MLTSAKADARGLRSAERSVLQWPELTLCMNGKKVKGGCRFRGGPFDIRAEGGAGPKVKRPERSSREK